jgi:hypothetical protein
MNYFYNIFSNKMLIVSALYLSFLFLFVIGPTIYEGIFSNDPKADLIRVTIENIKYHEGLCEDNQNYCLKANITGRFAPCVNCKYLRCNGNIEIDFTGKKVYSGDTLEITSYECGDRILIGDDIDLRYKKSRENITQLMTYHFLIPFAFILCFHCIRSKKVQSFRFVQLVKQGFCYDNSNNRIHPVIYENEPNQINNNI